MERWIIVRFEGSGFHRWKDAPTEYAHLRHLHHHTFRVTCRIEVTDADHQLEFIDVAAQLRMWFQGYLRDFAGADKSCEMLAEQIAACIVEVYEVKGAVEVEVTEDGIHGGGFGRSRTAS